MGVGWLREIVKSVEAAGFGNSVRGGGGGGGAAKVSDRATLAIQLVGRLPRSFPKLKVPFSEIIHAIFFFRICQC